MKKNLLYLPLLALTLVACDRTTDQPRNMAESNPMENVDNTGQNVRDRNSQTKTAGDQSESEADRTITQNIRQAIIAKSDFSTNAKNVKIITIGGNVTLRGTVDSKLEKDWIEKKAGSFSGVNHVENFLEIKQ